MVGHSYAELKIPHLPAHALSQNTASWVNELTLPEAPDGWENVLISIMYYDESIGGWSHCVSYKAVGNSLHLITGGPSYGVSVVVGGVDCYRCSNATWRAYYIQQKI